MDIDDLLQEFDDNSVPAGTRDINDLTQAWIAERTAPEILPFQNDLLERLMDRVRQQVWKLPFKDLSFNSEKEIPKLTCPTPPGRKD